MDEGRLMYSKLTVVKADTGAKGDSDLSEEAKLCYGNVACMNVTSRRRFETRYAGEAGQKLGLLFPDEVVKVQWKETPWTTEELLT
jgi:hypothetical protein